MEIFNPINVHSYPTHNIMREG